MIALRTMMMRGGNSSGVYLLKSDLDETGLEPDVLLSAILGSLDQRQIDRVGGDSSTTSKVAIVGPSTRPDCDIDYLFARVDLATLRVDWTVTCGNLLAGVASFAIERGLIADPHAAVRVHLVNTGTAVTVSGAGRGRGILGRATPIDLMFSNFCGGRTGRLFPTGRPIDCIGGVAFTAIDAGSCAIIAEARQFGITGGESPQQLNRNSRLLDRLERLRLRAALLMGLGDPRGFILPKVILVSESQTADIRSRYFVPDRCDISHAVSGALCLATAGAVSETVVARLLGRPSDDRPIVVENAAGTTRIDITRAGVNDLGMCASVRSSARKLFDGFVFADLYREPCLIGAAGAGVT